MKVNCQDHRKAMKLIGLKLRLKDGNTDQEERDEIEKRIRIPERELNLD